MVKFEAGSSSSADTIEHRIFENAAELPAFEQQLVNQIVIKEKLSNGRIIPRALL